MTSKTSRHTLISVVGLMGLIFACPWAHAQVNSDTRGVFSNIMAGSEFEYSAKRGDYLARISSRHGVSDNLPAADNGLPANRVLRSEEKIRINNRHIVPPMQDEDIVINLLQRMLFLFDDGALDAAYPVGLGKYDWPTPSGKFSIISHQENKAWIVPK